MLRLNKGEMRGVSQQLLSISRVGRFHQSHLSPVHLSGWRSIGPVRLPDEEEEGGAEAVEPAIEVALRTKTLENVIISSSALVDALKGPLVEPGNGHFFALPTALGRPTQPAL